MTSHHIYPSVTQLHVVWFPVYSCFLLTRYCVILSIHILAHTQFYIYHSAVYPLQDSVKQHSLALHSFCPEDSCSVQDAAVVGTWSAQSLSVSGVVTAGPVRSDVAKDLGLTELEGRGWGHLRYLMRWARFYFLQMSQPRENRPHSVYSESSI